MKFTNLVELFSHLLLLKKKYPIVMAYHKYLMSLDKEQQKTEVNTFIIWVGTNPQLKNKTISNPKFTGTGKGKTIFFDVVLKLGDDAFKTKFWALINKFHIPESDQSSINTVFNKIQNDDLVRELLSDLNLEDAVKSLDVGNFQVEDIDDILFSPKFIPTLSKLKCNISEGKYNYSTFMPLIKSTISDLKNADDVEEGSKNTLSVLDRELGNFSKGKKPDLGKVITAIKVDPLVNQTSFNSFLEGWDHKN